MKKILCLILIGVLCLSLSGCFATYFAYKIGSLWTGGNVPKYEQRQMLKHLEKKYGEEFVIKKIHKARLALDPNRGATVYPKGREDEAFYVGLGSKNRKKIVDEYVLREPQKKMLPIYEEWIQSMIPSAKVGVELSFFSYAAEVFYDPDKSIQEFIDNSKDIMCNISIILSEELLPNKDEIFEKLSNLPDIEPLSGFQDTNYSIGFLKKDAFDNATSGEYISIPSAFWSYIPGDKDYVAITNFSSKNSEIYKYSKEENLYHLNIFFKQQEDLSELENKMLPVYEEWIQSAIPTAKIAINLVLLIKEAETFYDPDKSFQQFADDAKHVDCSINIILSEELLPNKDEIFEKLGTLLEIQPVLFHKSPSFDIIFLTKEAFDDIESGEFVYIPNDWDEPKYKNFFAVSELYSRNEPYSKEEITEILHNNFIQKEDTE